MHQRKTGRFETSHSDDKIHCHEHLCLLHKSDAELIPAVVSYIENGVKSEEKCVYLNSGEQLLDRVLQTAVAAQKEGVNVLVSLTKEESWTVSGSLDPIRLFALLTDICGKALAEGFKGVRFICDMSWAITERENLDRLTKFEEVFTAVTSQNAATLLCLFNRSVFPPRLLLEMAKMHPFLDLGGKICKNLLYVPPECRSSSTELDAFITTMHSATTDFQELKQVRQELEEAYAALARKIYENWQEEDTLRASEQQLHEQDDALKEHNRRLRTILQHIPAVFAAFDSDHHLVSCNHEFERITSFHAEEVMGRRLHDLFDPEVAEEIVAVHPSTGGNYRGKEWQIRCKDGNMRCLSWSNLSRYIPISGWNNWIVGIDITQRRQAEDDLRRLTAEVKRHARELEHFSYNIAHDLNGHLAMISSHCRELQGLYCSALSDSRWQMLQQINDTTVDMVERITALLRFTMVSTCERSTQEVDLSAIASEIAGRLRIRAGAQPLTFKIEEGIIVRGNEKLLRLAMEQLLENAWKYAQREEKPLISFGTTQIEGQLTFFVCDNGIRERAIPSSFIGAVGRASAPPSIGLATVKRIISLHRGRVWSAEYSGKGSILYFTV